MNARVWLLLMLATAIMSFAAIVLVVIPRTMFAANPPKPTQPAYTPEERLGFQIYTREGCVYCHSQQVRDATISTDEARGWGRPTVPNDFVHDNPHQLGTMRTGPDLANVGARLPDRRWHLLHLYQPHTIIP